MPSLSNPTGIDNAGAPTRLDEIVAIAIEQTFSYGEAHER